MMTMMAFFTVGIRTGTLDAGWCLLSNLPERPKQVPTHAHGTLYQATTSDNCISQAAYKNREFE
jgi:hypothetical protein